MTKESFRDQPGQLSLTLRCASSISTQNQDAHTIETHHQKDIEHFSYGSLFYSGTCLITMRSLSKTLTWFWSQR